MARGILPLAEHLVAEFKRCIASLEIRRFGVRQLCPNIVSAELARRDQMKKIASHGVGLPVLGACRSESYGKIPYDKVSL
jgi:hypothetical protein